MRYLTKLALKSIRYRKATLFLSIVSISMSVVLLLGVERIRSNVQQSFTSTISGTDLIVGARSGNIPLLLSIVFHMGFPNQNVSWETYEHISSLRSVAWTIPISLGDSHHGFAVVATDASFFDHFRYSRNQSVRTQAGSPSVEGKNCVIGAKAAKELRYSIGDTLVVTHGMGREEFIKHEQDPFIVSAVLRATGTPVDKSIFISLNALHDIHADFYGSSTEGYDILKDVPSTDPHHDEHLEKQHEQSPDSISGLLVGLKHRNEILSVQRFINNYKEEPLTAIMPVVTLSDLWGIVRPIEKTLLVISTLVLIVALGGILTTLITSLNDRRREMAILRSVGAKPKHIFGLIIIETLGVILCGIIAGVFMLHVLLYLCGPIISGKLGLAVEVGWFSINEIAVLAAVFVLGGAIGVIPAYQSYKNAISDGLLLTR